MLVAIINVHIKPEAVDEFKTITNYNASNSLKEPGVIRFDAYQQSDDSTRFVLVEIYKNEEDPARHRETAHYIRWRDTVANLMAEPRTRNTYNIVFLKVFNPEICTSPVQLF